MKLLFKIVVLLCAFIGVDLCIPAQTAVPPPTPQYQPWTDTQLDQLLGPIALYPDPLIAEILPASTLPSQIVLADRYISGGGDANQIDEQPWDASVRALARYPDVLKWMDDNLNWTTELGQAFLNQQADVMASIQRLRQSAENYGNLQSTPQQQVSNDEGEIEIVPANPEVIYVPIYQPNVVYYQTSYGSPFVTFGVGWPIGSWLDCDFDWWNHCLIVWNYNHPRPPNWWHEPPHQRDMGHVTVWHPKNPPGQIGVNRGDRGWGNASAPIVARPEPARQIPHNQPVVATVSHSISDSAAPRGMPTPRPVMPIARPAPTPVEHQTINRPESNGAFIGSQSSHDARTYSNRGQQSVQTITHSTPAPPPVSRPAPAMPSGGGGNNSNSHKNQ
jgi:hypothetical protein